MTVPLVIPPGVSVTIREVPRKPRLEPRETGDVSVTTRLSPRDFAVIRSVRLLAHVTTGQLQRLHFSEPGTSPTSRPIRTRRVLRRLVAAGEVARVEENRPIGSHIGGSDSYTYCPPGRVAPRRDPHTVDVAEVYTRLHEAEARGECEVLEFSPEDNYVDGKKYKADAYVWLDTPTGKCDWLVEVDRGSETNRSELRAKFRAYTSAARKSETFPRVIFVVTFNYGKPLERRVALLEAIAKKQEFPEMFTICLMDEAIEKLLSL